MLPVKGVSCGMAVGWIFRVRRNPRLPGGGDVKPPAPVAAANGEVAIKRPDARFHATGAGSIPTTPMSSPLNLIPKKVNFST